MQVSDIPSFEGKVTELPLWFSYPSRKLSSSSRVILVVVFSLVTLLSGERGRFIDEAFKEELLHPSSGYE